MTDATGLEITSLKAYAVAGPASDLCFVKVETSQEGLFGWGEASLPLKCNAVASAIAELQPLVTGMDPIAVERCWQRMYRHSFWRGGPILSSSISGVDQALWDIRGKVLGLPVHRLLGGPVRDKVLLYANLGLSCDGKELARRAAAARALGYVSFKFYPLPALAAIEGPRAPIAVADACMSVRDEIGPDMSFCVDFHGRCSTSIAVQIESAVRDSKPMWIEEPTPPEDLDALARCSDKFIVPIAAGERLFTRWGFKELMHRRLIDIAQPDVANAGGISEMMRIAAMAEMHGIALAPHNPNGPVQAMASLHVAAAAPAFTILEHRHDLADRLAEFCSAAPTIGEGGYATLPKAPGLGVELDEGWLAAHPAVPVVFESQLADGSIGNW